MRKCEHGSMVQVRSTEVDNGTHVTYVVTVHEFSVSLGEWTVVWECERSHPFDLLVKCDEVPLLARTKA